jgi:hypothetical protein
MKIVPTATIPATIPTGSKYLYCFMVEIPYSHSSLTEAGGCTTVHSPQPTGHTPRSSTRYPSSVECSRSDNSAGSGC